MKCDIYRSEKKNKIIIFVSSGADIEKILARSNKNELGEIQYIGCIDLIEDGNPFKKRSSFIINKIIKDGFFIKELDSVTEYAGFLPSGIGAGLGAGILATSLGLTPIVGAAIGLLAGIIAATNAKGDSK
jgi:uncharacterized protein YcgL (UPF0745 family)